MENYTKSCEEWLEEAIKNYLAGHYSKALIACENAIRLDATCARAYHGRGLILTQQKRYKDALEDYQKSYQMEPENAKLYADLGDLFYTLNNYEKSRESYMKAIQLNEKYDNVYCLKLNKLVNNAMKLYTQELCYDAITAFKKVLSFDPNNNLARYKLHTLEEKYTSISPNNYFYSKCPLSPQQTPDTHNQPVIYNNEWSSLPRIHPFNCRCAQCIEF